MDCIKVGLEFQPKKSACNIVAKEFCTAEWDTLRAVIPNGSITDADGNEVFGMAVCNVPVGLAAFVKAYLARKGTHTLGGFATIDCLLDSGQWPHLDVPAWKILLILTLACFPHPDCTLEFAESIDA